MKKYFIYLFIFICIFSFISEKMYSQQYLKLIPKDPSWILIKQESKKDYCYNKNYYYTKEFEIITYVRERNFTTKVITLTLVKINFLTKIYICYNAYEFYFPYGFESDYFKLKSYEEENTEERTYGPNSIIDKVTKANDSK